MEPSSTYNTLKLQEMLPSFRIGCTHCALSDLLSLTSKEPQRTPLCCMCAQKRSLSCAQRKKALFPVIVLYQVTHISQAIKDFSTLTALSLLHHSSQIQQATAETIQSENRGRKERWVPALTTNSPSAPST